MNQRTSLTHSSKYNFFPHFLFVGYVKDLLSTFKFLEEVGREKLQEEAEQRQND